MFYGFIKRAGTALIVGAMLLIASAAAFAAPSPFTLPEGAVVIYVGIDDVTGDGVLDQVFLAGKRLEADSDFMAQHGLYIISGKDGSVIEKWLGDESAGYPGTISFGRMNPDASVDMLIELPSGGSGGITTAMPVTFQDGKYALLADLYLLNDGPSVDFVVEDGYKLTVKYEGIGYTLDLLNGKAKDDEGIYKGLYDANGRKVGTLKPAIDPVSASELMDLNNDGIFEIVTYRSIWAAYHANGLGYARSTWGWEGDAIKPRFVSVKPNFNPQSYVDYINSITETDPVEAMKLAVAKYLTAFEAAPKYWRYQGYMVLRSYQEAVAEKVTAALPEVSSADQATMTKVYEYADKLAGVGIGIFYVGQGRIAAIPDPKFHLAKFEKYLPKDAIEFLLLETVEVYDIWVADGALQIQMEEVGNRLHDWEYFLQSYQDSPLSGAAMEQYVAKLAAFLLGMDNTPNFSYTDGSLNPGVMASFEKYVREFYGSPSAGVVSKAMDLIRANKGKLTQQMIDQIIGLLPKPVEQEAAPQTQTP